MKLAVFAAIAAIVIGLLRINRKKSKEYVFQFWFDEGTKQGNKQLEIGKSSVPPKKDAKCKFFTSRKTTEAKAIEEMENHLRKEYEASRASISWYIYRDEKK